MTLSLFYEEQAFPTLLICLNLRAALLILPPVIYEEQAFRTLFNLFEFTRRTTHITTCYHPPASGAI